MVRAMKVPGIRIVLGAVLAAAALPSSASAGEGAWANGAKASVRLVAAGIGPDGAIDAAIEIVLPEGWHTYWRAPGEAGIAPTFDFSASTNVASADVAFPAPAIHDDGFAVTNVYDGRVMLPVRVAVTDPAAPVDLAVTVVLGVCADICVPDTVSASLAIVPGDIDAAASESIAKARAGVPMPAEPGVFAVTGITRTGGTDKKPVFRIAATVPEGGDPRVFVEGPHDWRAYAPVAVSASGTEAVWDVKFSRRGAEVPIAGAELRITIAAGGRAIEQTLTVD